MTALSKLILEKYQLRMRKKQKDAFIALLQEKLPYEVKVEKAGFSRNLVIGDLESAKYVLTAHYDTQPVLPIPNFLTPKNIPLYLLYSLALAALIAGIIWGGATLGFLVTHNAFVSQLTTAALLCLIFGYMLFGKANRHTANDNTSGVLTLLEALEHEEIRKNCCIVLFDHEEMGTFGSSFFASKHKKQMKDKLLINFDCVGEGDHIMFIFSKKALSDREKFEKAFLPMGEKQIVIDKASATIYPSDQMNFKYNVGVAAFKKKKGIGYYIDRIHTNKDTVCDEQNLILLVEGLKRFCADEA